MGCRLNIRDRCMLFLHTGLLTSFLYTYPLFFISVSARRPLYFLRNVHSPVLCAVCRVNQQDTRDDEHRSSRNENVEKDKDGYMMFGRVANELSRFPSTQAQAPVSCTVQYNLLTTPCTFKSRVFHVLQFLSSFGMNKSECKSKYNWGIFHIHAQR